MKKYLFKFWPIIFIFFLWSIFSNPYFIKGKVPYPSTYQVNFFAPWSHEQKFWGPVKNGAMPDVIDQIYPWKHFTIESFKTGQIPWWNPNSFAGNPHVANFQSAVFSPFNLLYFVFQFIDAWSLVVLLQVLLTGIFTYLLARSFGVSKIGALISSISFMFCGFIVVWMAYGTLSMTVAFLPLALFAIQKSFAEKQKNFLAILSIALPLSIFSGHFQSGIYVTFFTFCFLVYRIIESRDKNISLAAIFAFIIGIIISLLQILPSIQFYLYSIRSGIFIKDGGIPFFYLINLFAPDFFGNPVTRNDWFGYYAEWASFVGIIPLILAIYGLIIRKNKTIIFFGIMTLITFALAVDSPLQAFISLLKIPVISTSSASRIIFLCSFSISILAGFGLDNLLEILNKQKKRNLFIPFFVFGLIIVTVWLLIFIGKMMPYDKLLIARRNFVLPTVLFMVSFFLVFISSFRKHLFIVMALFLLAIASFDSLRFAQKWMPFDPKELVYPKLPVIQALQKNLYGGRAFGNFGAFLDTYYNIPSIEGYDPLYIQRYGEFVRSSEKGEFLNAERSVVTVDRNGKYINRVLDLLNVTVIFHPIADTNQGWAYPVWKDKERFSIIYHDSHFQLFRNNFALPHVTLFYDYEVISKKEDIVKRFYSDMFDYRKKLIVEESISFKRNQKSDGNVKILKYSPQNIAIVADTNSDALLFLSDNYYPGWKAKVDGKEAKIYRADYAFRAIILPEGKHEVVFYYNPIL